MEPIKWDGPSIEPGVKRRLKRLDTYLRVTFSPYALDTLTGRPIQMDGYAEDGSYLSGALIDPAHFLWRKDPNSSHHFFVRSYSVHTGGFGHLEVLHLEADVARHRSPSEAWRFLKAATDRNLARKAKVHKDYLSDKVRANQSLALDIAQGRRTDRTAKAVSYPGQTSHTSSHEQSRIVLSNRELGVEE
jgi:hypothetical protein